MREQVNGGVAADDSSVLCVLQAALAEGDARTAGTVIQVLTYNSSHTLMCWCTLETTCTQCMLRIRCRVYTYIDFIYNIYIYIYVYIYCSGSALWVPQAALAGGDARTAGTVTQVLTCNRGTDTSAIVHVLWHNDT
jgi:hypothetical protein